MHEMSCSVFYNSSHRLKHIYGFTIDELNCERESLDLNAQEEYLTASGFRQVQVVLKGSGNCHPHH